MKEVVTPKECKRRNTKKTELKSIKKIQINLDKKQKMYLIIGIIVLIGIIIINNYIQLGLVINKTVDNKDAVEVNLQTSNNKIIPYENEVLVYNNSVITSYNNYGKNTGKIILEDVLDADINTSGKYIQVIDKSKGLVYIYKNKYEIARIKLDAKIYSGIINSNGTSVIEYSSGKKTELGIYDKNGNKKYNVKLNNSIIGKYVLSKNDKYLAYIDVNVDGISVQTSINVIDLSKVSNQNSGLSKVYTLDNSLAYDIYWDGKYVISRFEDSYVLYNVNSSKKEIVSIDEGQVVAYADYNKMYACISSNSEGKYVLNINKMLSKYEKNIELKETPKYITYDNGIIYVGNQKSIEAYNNLGMKIKKYNSDIVITEPVIFNNGRSAALVVSNKLIMFTI